MPDIPGHAVNPNKYDLRNAKLNPDGYSSARNSLSFSRRDENIQKDLNNLKTKSSPGVRVKANQFADKIRSIDSVSATTSDAKRKLLEMRFSASDQKNIAMNEFSVLMDRKPFSIEFINNSGQKEFIFNPEKIQNGLEGLNFPLSSRKHNIFDRVTAKPPVSAKVADLQQLLALTPDGLFGAETFNALIDKYLNSLLENNMKILDTFEKLMLSLMQKIGQEAKFGAYIKGLLVVKAVLAAVEAGKPGEFDKLSLMMNKYLPDSVRFKVKERVRVVRRLSELISSTEPQKTKLLNAFINDEMKILIKEDKLKVLEAYLKAYETSLPNEKDVFYQMELIKSLVDEELTEQQKQMIIANINLLIRFYKESGGEEGIKELQALYNRIKLQAMKQIMK